MKKISLLLFYIVFTMATFAQNEVNTTFSTTMNATFGNLDKTKVPHGILLDYGMEFTNIPRYNGVLTDSTFSDKTSLTQIYNTLLTSRIRDVSTGFVNPTEYETRWQNNRNNTSIVLGGLYFKYVQISNTALATNKITKVGSVLYDKYIGAVWQNPYQEFQTFAMSPAIKSFDGLSMQVKIPTTLFYSNYQNLVQSIQIDFGNGAGYVAVPLDQNIAVNYTTEGVKIWKYKLTLTNGTIMYNQSRIKLFPGIDTVPYTSVTGSQRQSASASGLYSKVIVGSKQHLGVTGNVKLTIDLAAGHTQITKPLIVAEGFDLGALFSPENINGTNNYNSFKRSVRFSDSPTLRDLIETSNKQYDIIYVDWNNGVDYIQRNAYALEEVIKWVNAQKPVGSTVQNVVLGQSMGGVIARYALADMEQDGVSHQTRLFVSHDAPQQGANIPISLQYLYRHLTRQYMQTSTTLFGGFITVPIIENNFGISNYLSILDVPATRQLLSNWSNLSYEIDNTIHTNFYNELKGKGVNPAVNGGYPVNCRNIAISNGAECGVGQGFAPNSDLVNYNWNKGLTFAGDLLSMVYLPLGGAVGGLFLDNDFFGVTYASLIPGKSTFDVNFNAKAMPYGTGNQIYKGKISYTKKILWLWPKITVNITNVQLNQPAGILPIDSYAGGFYNTRFATGNLNVPNLYIRDRFNFIPTTSAIDIGKKNIVLNDFDYTRAYVGGQPPAAPKNSPFNNFATDFERTNPNFSNKSHLSFSNRNSDWLAKELNGSATTTDCSYICANVPINGPSTLCDTGTYTAPVGGNNFFWSVTQGASLVTLSGNGTANITLTALPNVSGSVILTLNMGDNGTCGNVVVTKNVWVGIPKVTNFAITGGYDNAPINSSDTFNVSIAQGATSYQWSIIRLSTNCGCITDADGLLQCPPNTTFANFQYGSSSSTASINWGSCQGTYVVNCSAANDCGLDGIGHKVVNVYSNSGGGGGGNPCIPQLQVYPNPIKNGIIEANIAFPGNPCNNNLSSFRINENVEIEIYDLQNNKVVSRKFNKNNINISDANLKKGHYILIAKIENEKPIKKIIIIE